ncbi:MAG: hypothetical protein ABR991_10060 [Terracidiphilus sp.]
MCILAILSVGIGFFLFSITPNALSSLWFEIFDLAMVLCGFYFAVFAFRYCVIFDAESVTVAGPIAARSLKRSEVTGRNRIIHWGSSWLDYDVLEAHNPKQKSLMILDDIGFNKEWEDWYYSLPNLNHPRKPKIYFKKKGKHTQDRRLP